MTRPAGGRRCSRWTKAAVRAWPSRMPLPRTSFDAVNATFVRQYIAPRLWPAGPRFIDAGPRPELARASSSP